MVTIRQVKQELLRRQILKELSYRQCRKSLLDFVKLTFPTYQVEWYHEIICQILQLFSAGRIRHLILSLPPQHGKSELSTRRLPAYLLGNNPKLRISIASYNQTKVREFSKDIQRIMSEEIYTNIFPETIVKDNPVARELGINNSDIQKTQDKFEVMNKIGYKTGDLRAVGRGGALTGNPVDIMIMDDLYKDYAEGNSPVIRQSVIDWYTSVVKSRFHNDSQELIVFTRWHEDDLIGYIEKEYKVETLTSFEQLENPNNKIWYKLNFPALKTPDCNNEFDNREIEDPLWKDRHNIEKLLDYRKLDREKFESLYQGDPQPLVGLLFTEDFKTYTEKPPFKYRFNYTDTADTGDDYLCSINFGVGIDNFIYILDVYYTQEPQEITEVAVAEMLSKDNINTAYIESNNGGRGFARNVDRISGYKHEIQWFFQSANKESRILTNASNIKRLVVLPLNWQGRWNVFAKHVTRFKKNFKANKHDDCLDCLVGICEYSGLLDNNDMLWR